MPSTLRFFDSLPALERFSDVADAAKYTDAPDDWFVVITDVEGSTRSIEAGRYKDVNALGVASIVAVQNACEGISLPYTFGGDGATLLVPASFESAVRRALEGVRAHAAREFALGMRGGMVPIRDLREAGHDVRVARFTPSAKVSLAMFAGSGIGEAEVWVKDPDGSRYCVTDVADSQADFSGFECRWSPVEAQRDRMISLLVLAFGDEDARTATYRRVIDRIEQVLGGDGRPVSSRTLKLARDPSSFDVETRLRFGSGLSFAIARWAISLQTAIGRRAMQRGEKLFGFDGAKYLAETVLQTDFRKFDETLRMVLDVHDDELEEIEGALADSMERGELVYGIHRSSTALVTCHVMDREGRHVHFVDGSDGGYALAAKAMKARLKARTER